MRVYKVGRNDQLLGKVCIPVHGVSSLEIMLLDIMECHYCTVAMCTCIVMEWSSKMELCVCVCVRACVHVRSSKLDSY